MSKKATQRRLLTTLKPVQEEKAPFNPDDCIKPSKRLSSKQIKKQGSRPSKGLVHRESSSRFLKTGDVFTCPVCKKRSFEKAQALGGHMSKSHPSQSADFTRKQVRRKERAPDRERLKRAKELYILEHGPTKHFARNKLNFFKNILREEEKARESSITTAEESSDSTQLMTP